MKDGQLNTDVAELDHWDGRGDNRPTNLWPLCMACHVAKHRGGPAWKARNKSHWESYQLLFVKYCIMAESEDCIGQMRLFND